MECLNTLRAVLSQAELEMRKPLSLIQGYIETLKTGAIKNSESMAKCLEVMDKHSRRLLHVIDDVSTVARIEANHAPCPCDDMFLQRCFESAVERLTPQIEMAEAELVAEIPAGRCQLKGDRMIWQSVFDRLLEEVLKGQQRKARVRITAVWGDCGCELVIESTATSLFRQESATGGVDWSVAPLGLLVVRRALELSDGSMEWHTDGGSSARFVLNLPCGDCNYPL